MNDKLVKALSCGISLITISSINQWLDVPVGNTFIWWIIQFLVLIIFLKARKKVYDSGNNKNITIVKIYILWNAICIARAIFIAENYWEWKNLVAAGTTLLLPLSIYATTNKMVVQSISAYWVRFALPAFFIFAPFFSYGDAIGMYLVPISFLLLFFPALNKKWKIFVVVLTLIVLLGDFNARSNFIKFSIALLLGLSYYFKRYLDKLLRFARLIFFILPILFFILAISGTFNIFKINQYIGGSLRTTIVEKGEIKEADLTSDTRTFLYEEVLLSAVKHQYILFGRSPARGNDSEAFGYQLAEELKTGKWERFGNEVSILNVFTWTGLIGVVLYFFIFYSATSLAIKRSKNRFIKIVGLYVSFRWTYAWVEDFSRFDLYYIFLWIMIGMCYSKSFREMSDSEVICWVRGIFRLRNGELVTRRSKFQAV